MHSQLAQTVYNADEKHLPSKGFNEQRQRIKQHIIDRFKYLKNAFLNCEICVLHI